MLLDDQRTEIERIEAEGYVRKRDYSKRTPKDCDQYADDLKLLEQQGKPYKITQDSGWYTIWIFPEGSNVLTYRQVERALSRWHDPVPGYSRLDIKNRRLIHLYEVDPGVEGRDDFTRERQESIEKLFQSIRAGIRVRVTFVAELEVKKSSVVYANSVYSVELISDHVIED